MAMDVAESGAGIGTPLMTEDQYAALWQVDVKTVRAWGRQGLVRVLRRGRVTRYLLDVPKAAEAVPANTAQQELQSA
jgi:hypothetical protein